MKFAGHPGRRKHLANQIRGYAEYMKSASNFPALTHTNSENAHSMVSRHITSDDVANARNSLIDVFSPRCQSNRKSGLAATITYSVVP